MSKEFQIRDGNLIASFDLENEDGDIDFCKLLKISHGVADEIGMFVDYVATNKIIKDQSKQIADLEAKLAESEAKKESYRLQNDEHHLQLCQFYSRLGVEAFGADIHEKALETLMFMKEELEEKNGVRRALSVCNRRNDEFADMIKKLEGEKEELKQQLAEKDKAIENWQTMYESVVQTCHNDKEEIERLNKQLETQENTITNLVEDNRASQEWYKKQLADTEEQNKRVLEKLELIVSANQELEQKLAEKEKEITQRLVIQERDYNQDKISFCIEQLEKVKETTECVLDNALKNSSLNQSYYDRLLDEINNQIKAIKGEK